MSPQATSYNLVTDNLFNWQGCITQFWRSGLEAFCFADEEAGLGQGEPVLMWAHTNHYSILKVFMHVLHRNYVDYGILEQCNLSVL